MSKDRYATMVLRDLASISKPMDAMYLRSFADEVDELRGVVEAARWVQNASVDDSLDASEALGNALDVYGAADPNKAQPKYPDPPSPDPTWRADPNSAKWPNDENDLGEAIYNPDLNSVVPCKCLCHAGDVPAPHHPENCVCSVGRRVIAENKDVLERLKPSAQTYKPDDVMKAADSE